MNYILECDSFSPKKLSLWLKAQNNQNTYYILHKKGSIEKFKSSLSESENAIGIIYEDLFNYAYTSLPSIDFSLFKDDYLKDGMPFYLLDRDGYFPTYGQGNHNAMVFYLSRVPHIVGFLREKEINGIYFRNTPHLSIEWLVAKSSNYCEIDIIVSQRHILPWRYSLSKDFGRNREALHFDSDDFNVRNNTVELEHLEEFIKLNSKDYELALPSYEKKRMVKRGASLINPIKQWRELVFKPPHYFAKYKAYKTYNTLAIEANISQRFVTFFLHYQPERTTLPEGYGFQNQLLAIMELRDSLPEDIFIYVKEHPSMFTNNWHPKARNEKFYYLLLELPNVVLVKLTQNTFDLIDHALAIATITGTVGLQAYIRKTPVIYFGLSMFKAPGVHVYSDIENLKLFISKLMSNNIKIEDIRTSLVQALKGSLSGLPSENDVDLDYHSSKGYQEKAHFKLLTHYFKENIKAER
jgi:hypothetical protein